MIEPKRVKETLLDEFWVNATQEVLEQFSRNHIWTLVIQPNHKNVIATKQIFKNKTDKFGNIARNEVRLVAQGYTQVKGVDFDETFAPAERLESTQLLLAIACHAGFKLFQMHVKVLC